MRSHGHNGHIKTYWLLYISNGGKRNHNKGVCPLDVVHGTYSLGAIIGSRILWTQLQA